MSGAAPRTGSIRSVGCFNRWISLTLPGEPAVVYHVTRRSLAADRQKDAELNALADAIGEAIDRGEVAVFQRRIPGGRFEYLVTRTCPPRPYTIPAAARAGSAYSSRNRGVVWHGRIAA
jgi:hypothetical protein